MGCLLVWDLGSDKNFRGLGLVQKCWVELGFKKATFKSGPSLVQKSTFSGI